MAYNFPDTPTLGQLFNYWTWDGEKWSSLGLPISGATVRGHIAGLTLSTAGSTATFAITAGVAADSNGVAMMTLASTYSKTASAWAVGSGNGALDTGAIAASTWYHAYLIRRVDTGVVDALVSLSPTAPTLPPNYTQFRRIGSMLTNASSQWVAFTQFGDAFYWVAATTDLNTANVTTVDTAFTISVPTGIRVEAFCIVTPITATATVFIRIRSPDIETTSPAPPSYTNGFANIVCSTNASSVMRVADQFGPLITNTAAQINIQGGGAHTVTLVTLGWRDRRGRDA